MTWLTRPVVLLRGHALAAGLVVGLLCAAGILIGVHAINKVRSERDDRLAGQILTRSEVEAIARRIARVEQPTRKDIVLQIRRALDVCARASECRVVVRRLNVAVDRAQRGLPPTQSNGRIRPQPGKQGNGGLTQPGATTPATPITPDVTTPVIPRPDVEPPVIPHPDPGSLIQQVVDGVKKIVAPLLPPVLPIP